MSFFRRFLSQCEGSLFQRFLPRRDVNIPIFRIITLQDKNLSELHCITLRKLICTRIALIIIINNNTVIYIAPFTMCSKRLEESRKKMRFKFVFEPVHMIDSMDTARQPIPKMRPSHRKGTIARLFFGTRDLKCNGQIRTEI